MKDIRPSLQGTYVLVMWLQDEAVLLVGRLAEHVFAAGYYVYIGSALGAGGLAARLNRHLTWPDNGKKLHWHIDYLLQRAVVVAVWYQLGPERLECKWAQILVADPAFSVPVPGFGASDCHCPSHLFHTRLLPDEMGLEGLAPNLVTL